MGRLRFAAYNLVSFALFFLFYAVLYGLLDVSVGPDWAKPLTVVASIPCWLLSIMWSFQRSHDMNWSGWTVFVSAWFPVVGFIWLFRAGTPGRNRFGAPPSPNGAIVGILGWLLPVFWGCGLAVNAGSPAYHYFVQLVGMRRGNF
ncbi:MAG: hypothetical protein JWP29_2456 [Rhodoferax sp.]|nr:hypothetical protein [Rhodoferax sp.]